MSADAIKTPCKQGTKDGLNACNIYDRNNEGIASVYGVPVNTRVSEVSDHFAAGMAAAAFIVKAVNSHTALVEALKKVVAAEDRFVSESGILLVDPVCEAIEVARAALALAGEAP